MSAKAVRWVPLDRDWCTLYEINKSMLCYVMSLAKTKGIKGVVDLRQWVSVLLGDAVEASIIDAEMPRSIFLPSHDYRSRPWGIRLIDNSVLQHEVDVFPHFDFLSR